MGFPDPVVAPVSRKCGANESTGPLWKQVVGLEAQWNKGFGQSWGLLDLSHVLWDPRHLRRFGISETMRCVMSSGKEGER